MIRPNITIYYNHKKKIILSNISRRPFEVEYQIAIRYGCSAISRYLENIQCHQSKFLKIWLSSNFTVSGIISNTSLTALYSMYKYCVYAFSLLIWMLPGLHRSILCKRLRWPCDLPNSDHHNQNKVLHLPWQGYLRFTRASTETLKDRYTKGVPCVLIRNPLVFDANI